MILNNYQILLAALETTNTMKKLANHCRTAIHTKEFEPFSEKYMDLVERLPIDLGIIDLADSLTWAVYTTNEESNTGMEILTALANRYIREKDSIIIEDSDLFNLTMFIATDRPLELLQKLDRDHRLGLVRAIGWYFMELVEYDGWQNEIDDYNIYINIMCEKFIEEKDVLQIISEMKQEVGYDHRNINDLIHFISNLIQGNDKKALIKNMCRTKMSDMKVSEDDALLNEMVDLYGNRMTRTELSWLLTSIDTNFRAYVESTRHMGEIKLPSYEMGSLIWNLCSDFTNLNVAMGDDGRLDQEIIEHAFTGVYDRLRQYYYATNEVEQILLDVIRSYRKHGGDLGWLSSIYLKSIKLYLLKDEAFKMFYEDLGDGITTRLKLEADDAEFRKLLYRYTGLDIIEDVGEQAYESVSGEKKLIRRERELEQRERELDERERRLAERTNSKKKKTDPEDEEDTEDEDEEEDKKNVDYEIDASQSTKGYKKSSKTVSDASRNIYRAYHKFKRSESAVTSQLDKMLSDAKTAFAGGDKTEAILSGKRWTPMLILKQALRTAAVFSFSKIAGIIYLVSTVALDKRRTDRQRRAILGELDTEIRLIEEKIEDARGDGNRQAKYALMRTKGELERARDKIHYNINASADDMNKVREIIRNKRYGGR